VEIALCRDGEFVALAGLTPGDAIEVFSQGSTVIATSS